MDKPPDPLWLQVWNSAWSIVYLCFISSIIGGVAYLNKIRDDWATFRWRMLFLSAVTGAINGYFTFVICDFCQLSWQTTAIITGAAGGGGWEMLKYIIGRANHDFRKKL